MQTLTNSRLRLYRECRRKHRLTYVDRWRPKRDAEYFIVGRLIGDATAVWWEKGLVHALNSIPGNADPYVLEQVRALVVGYDRRWADSRDEYETIEAEATFSAPLLNPDTWRSSRTFTLEGSIDQLVRRRGASRVLVLERKTTSDAIDDATSPYWAKLAMDGQVSQYYIGAESLGHEIEGCVYDVIRKPALRPLKATPEASRKYKKDGTLYASQREEDETPEEYGDRVLQAVTKEPEKYYQRREVPRLESELREYMVECWQYARMMREDANLGVAPRNPEACHRFGACWAWEICAMGVKPEEHPDRYERLDDPFAPELRKEEAV